MENNLIIGRKAEIESLERDYQEKTMSLVLVQGRRRVGKTFLVNHVFSDRFVFKVTGSYHASMKVQLAHFMEAMEEYSGRKQGKVSSWLEAFRCLKKYLDSLPLSKRLVVFFDELPWFDTPKSGFLLELTDFINNYGAMKDNLMIIVCGSSSSWMDKKFNRSKGGLFNRQTDDIALLPFTLKETEAFLKSHGISWPRYDIVCLYMMIGGIPYYLNMLDSSLTLSENIDRLFFARNARLKGEFERIYETIFSKNSLSLKIMNLLLKHKSGLTRKEIKDRLKISDGGGLSEALNGLATSGFVAKRLWYYHGKKSTRYQLDDYFTLFYLKFIRGEAGRDEHYWTNGYNEAQRASWFGLTFEKVCRDHLFQIKKALGIAGVLSLAYSWEGGIGAKEAQIDLVIRRKDHVTTLCEVKFYHDVFSIDKEYSFNLLHKIEAYRESMHTKYSLQLVFISAYGLAKNMYSNLVMRSLTLDDLFD